MSVIRFAAALMLTCAVLGSAVAQPRASAPITTEQAQALFDAYWEWALHEYPEFATAIGDHRYDDRLGDQSAAAVARRKAYYAALRSQLDGVDDSALPPLLRTSLQVLRQRARAIDRLNEAYGRLPFGAFDDWPPVSQMDGIHLGLPQLTASSRFTSVADYEAYLARLRAVPSRIRDQIERMEVGLAAGWTLPGEAASGVPKQLDAQVVADPRDSPEFGPFRNWPPEIEPAERERLSKAAEAVIREQLVPAFRALQRFYVERYLPAARAGVDASSLPGGPAYYQALLDWYTTTTLTAREIHDLGLREVARIDAAMEASVAATGFKGTRAEFQHYTTSDPKFFYTRPEDMLAGYRDIAKRVDAELPRFFAVLPRLPYGVRAMRPEEGDNAEHYSGGDPLTGRAGYFEANVNDLRTRPRWTMETLVLHEAVPGHHLQTARAQELGDLPRFRRFMWFTAFGEGWALYAESLGDEMGFYKDPYQKFGNLSFEMLRACRLVVDTGLHAFGWSRARAIDYMVEHSGLTRADMTAEVDRYIVVPGQATAYKVGELKIKALRARARAALGERFDLRRFHNALIDGGALPLEVLEAQIDDWITSERSALK
ncbi:MAG: DUF885 domain-containing protein [Rubrivivax sp.]